MNSLRFRSGATDLASGLVLRLVRRLEQGALTRTHGSVRILLAVAVAMAPAACALQRELQIRATSDPPGANAYFQGQYLGPTPTTGTFKCDNSFLIAPSARFEKRGYETREDRLGTVNCEGQTIPIHATLAGRGADTGGTATALVIGSDPEGVSVTFNGEYLCTTPCALSSVWKAGEQHAELSFERSGYQSTKRTITPANRKVMVTMQPTKAAAR